MNIIHKTNPFYHILLKDIFFEGDLLKIKEKLISLKGNFQSEEHTGSAKIKEKFLKKNKGMFLKSTELEFFTNKIDSLLKQVKINEDWDNFCFKRIFNNLRWGSELVQYYQNNNYYLPHIDEGVFTMIFWIYEDQSKTKGGNLYFPEYDYLLNCKTNEGIIFFSKELHEVTKIESKKNFGRYSITSFSEEQSGKFEKNNFKYS
jgi:hypothetical protein